MEVAAEHPEAVGERSRVGMEEGLLFDRVALHAAHVAPGHVELAAAIEADLADARQAVGDGTAVAAREATHAVSVKLFVEVSLADVRVQNFAKCHVGRCHEALNLYFTPATAFKENAAAATKGKEINLARPLAATKLDKVASGEWQVASKKDLRAPR